LSTGDQTPRDTPFENICAVVETARTYGKYLGKMDHQLRAIYQTILDGQHKEIGALIEAALQSGLHPKAVLEDGMIAAMAEVGRLFETGEYYVPEMLISAHTMQAGLSVLKPYLMDARIQSAGKVAIGTVEGDLHDIGKNLVAMMLEGAGFEVKDMGVNVSPEKFVAVADDVDVIALSALLTTTMPGMLKVVEGLNVSGKRQMVKVIVGGAPVTAAYADQIGADGYAPDASRAVGVVKSLLGNAGQA
jgi:5-methyltetrahydrofolate--homocysteine methyltransferase